MSIAFRKWLFGTVVTLLLSHHSFLIFAAAQGNRSDILKVGVIAPLTGPLSEVGQTVKNCVLLTYLDLGSPSHVTFVFEDDQFIPRNTLSAVRKLISRDSIDALIVFGSSTSLAIANIAEQKQLPMFALAISDDITEGKQFVFRHFPSAKSQHHAILNKVKEKQYKSIGLVTFSHDAMLGLSKIMLQEKDVNIVVDEEVLPNDMDLKSLATKIRGKNPDAVYILMIPPYISVVTRALREVGYLGEFFGAVPIQHIGEVAAAQGTLENTWFATTKINNEEVFTEQYISKFGSLPHPDGFHACAVTKFVVEASGSKNLLADILNREIFTSIYGEYVLNKSNNTFELPITIKTVRGQKFIIED